MDEKVGFHESGMWLPIKIGKLDIPTTLADAANALKGQSVGVYIAGKHTIYMPYKACNTQLQPVGCMH